MKCVICNKTAIVVRDGNSLCKKCFKQEKLQEEYIQKIMLDEILKS
jgi:hypothetical protein